MYPGVESKPEEVKDVVVSVTDTAENLPAIHPLVFSEYVNIRNSELLKRIDLYDIDGRLIQRVHNPGSLLSTSGLLPGVYIFHLYTHENRQIAFKGIKR